MVKASATVLSVIILDQLTKLLTEKLISKPIELTGFLTLQVVHNTGAAFSILQDQRLMLIWTSIMVIGFLVYSHDYFMKHSWLAWSLIMAGAIGNLIDRLFLGYVIDFIDLSFWPSFNIADSAITIGALLILANSFSKKRD
ncbi:MAG: signal peptidase II [Candidatus Woesearchaeota archaeon]